jgi:hypothetical protein
MLPEAVCVGFICASIKANCRALSQAWIGHARRCIGAGDRHAANSPSRNPLADLSDKITCCGAGICRIIFIKGGFRSSSNIGDEARSIMAFSRE